MTKADVIKKIEEHFKEKPKGWAEAQLEAILNNIELLTDIPHDDQDIDWNTILEHEFGIAPQTKEDI